MNDSFIEQMNKWKNKVGQYLIQKLVIKNFNLKRYMHTNVHSSTIYNSQDMEAT